MIWQFKLYEALNWWFCMAVSKTGVLAFVIGLMGSNRHLKDRTG